MIGTAAGRFRHIITLQQPEPKPNRISGDEVIWRDVLKDIHASVEPLRGREYFQAQQVQSETTFRIRMRWFPQVKSTMRVCFGSRIFNIVAIIDPEERHRELQLMCKEGVNDVGD
ncbi:TPA: phage head closure protein [Proteus mirabilis]|nr:phage head closure protein [Proteus mirabilis]